MHNQYFGLIKSTRESKIFSKRIKGWFYLVLNNLLYFIHVLYTLQFSKEEKSYISTQKATKTATDVNGNAITHHLSTLTARIFMLRKQ